MSALRSRWTLDPAITFLNHGSFGACPPEVLDAQRAWRAQMEREPVRFFLRELEPLLDGARAALAKFVGADPEDLAFVSNATTGVNAVLRSLSFAPGDELLTTDHAYNACKNALQFVADRAGAHVVVARVPFPISSPEEVVSSVMACVTEKTRIALLDHVTSPTGLVWPIAELVAALAARGVDAVVDGAHAPGMLDLDLRAVAAAYYTGNCHKWMCAPKGAGFLHVRRDRQDRIRPTTISHGANRRRAGHSRFRAEFDWTGTVDPTQWLAVPTAIETIGGMLDGGWPSVRAHNHALALTARDLLCDALGVPPHCPDAMIGSLVALPIPDGAPAPRATPLDGDPLQDALLERFQIEVPIMPWPAPPRRLVRISAQLYNAPADYARLAAALVQLVNSSANE